MTVVSLAKGSYFPSINICLHLQITKEILITKRQSKYCLNEQSHVFYHLRKEKMSRGVKARDAIELLCRIFGDHGISPIDAETIRKAKFDKTEACMPLWKLLFELILFCKYRTKVNTVTCSKLTPVEQVVFIKKEMQKLGYLSRVFASLPSDMSKGSRELLLALAWLLHKEAIIEKFMEINDPPLPHDLVALFGEETDVSAPTFPKFPDRKHNLAQHIQQILTLNQKLKMDIRLLYAAQQEYVTLAHRVHDLTYGVSLSPEFNHLTTVQTYLLKHPQEMKKMMTRIEEDNVRMESLLEWDNKEDVFWEWMESVLDLKLQSMTDTESAVADNIDGVSNQGSCSDTSLAESEVYLDLPPNISADIIASRRKLMDLILQHETAFAKLEDLWAIKRATLSDFELKKLTASVNAEISELKSTLGREVKDDEHFLCDGPRLTFLKQTPGKQVAAKDSNAQESSTSIRSEIVRLQTEVKNLATEVNELRRDCLQRLNKLAAKFPNTVCVIPRPQRKLCQ